MHFWIDKRSQSCSFGRNRTGNVSTGYNFYHPPRRIRKAMIPPVHRSLHTVDTRPYVHRSHLHRSAGNRSYRHPEPHHHVPRPMQHEARAQNYRGPADYSLIQQYAQQIALEQGTLGLHGLQAGPSVSDDIHPDASQTLPSHLKCGMWAALVLATILLVAFQGSGLEILLFCAFSGTFFAAACTVSLCRRPRNLNFSHSQLDTMATNIPNIEQTERFQQPEIHMNIPIPDQISSSPPPYHIAILRQVDDSLPPPYDKIIA